MASLLEDFDPLASSSGPPKDLDKSEKDEILNEKFSVLFNPSTPHASPVLPDEPDSSLNSQPPSTSPLSPTDKFGAFVEVSEGSDPLASPGFGTFQSAQQDSTQSFDLSFFDAFTSEAERRTELRKEEILDPNPHTRKLSVQWDLDYFNSLPSQRPAEPKTDSVAAPQPLVPSIEIKAAPSPPKSPLLHSPKALRPKLSRTSTSPTMAPPTISQFPSSAQETDSESNDLLSQSWSDGLQRSSSYKTLSTFSSKWLGSGKDNDRGNPQANKRGALDSLWGVGSEILGHAKSWSDSSGSPSTLTLNPSNHASGLPHRSSSSPSPFAPHQHPFAPHIYIPPTGAPGYQGESTYDWDKGFSRELEEELSRPPSPKSNKSDTVMTSESVGDLITKKGGGIKLAGRKETTIGILDETLGNELRPSLPAIPRLSKMWTLLYSLDQDGISLRTLYEKSDLTKKAPSPKKPSSVILIVQDSYEAIFGVYLSDSRGIKLQDGSGERRYYGSGESFLFSKHSPKGELKVSKWTGKNDYVALCEAESLSFGGGNTTFGLYIASNLLDGSSGVCETFENDVLCHESNDTSSTSGISLGNGIETRRVKARRKGVDFEIVGLEVWGVGG